MKEAGAENFKMTTFFVSARPVAPTLFIATVANQAILWWRPKDLLLCFYK